MDQNLFPNLEQYTNSQLQQCYDRNENDPSGFQKCYQNFMKKMEEMQNRLESYSVYYSLKGQQLMNQGHTQKEVEGLVK